MSSWCIIYLSFIDYEFLINILFMLVNVVSYDVSVDMYSVDEHHPCVRKPSCVSCSRRVVLCPSFLKSWTLNYSVSFEKYVCVLPKLVALIVFVTMCELVCISKPFIVNCTLITLFPLLSSLIRLFFFFLV